MTAPQITIGITCYREGKFLNECWDSVLAQTDDRWEAVIVLDGGADLETTAIFNSLSHPKLRKFQFTENCGPYPARTKAIQEAQTGWYAHLDADDGLPPDAVKNILWTIERNPDADYVYGNCLTFSEKEAYVRETTGNKWELVDGTGVLCATAPIRIALFKSLNGFAEQLTYGGADLDFWIGVAEKNARGYDAHAIIYERRVRDGSVGEKRQPRNIEIAQVILSHHPQYFSNPERRQRYLGDVYQKMARYYRTIGNRQQAAQMALLAIENGETRETLTAILDEAKMPAWRYWLRRIGRKLPGFSQG